MPGSRGAWPRRDPFSHAAEQGKRLSASARSRNWYKRPVYPRISPGGVLGPLSINTQATAISRWSKPNFAFQVLLVFENAASGNASLPGKLPITQRLDGIQHLILGIGGNRVAVGFSLHARTSELRVSGQYSGTVNSFSMSDPRTRTSAGERTISMAAPF